MDDLDLGSTLRGFTPGQKVFNRYVLKKILGRGGMGVVWLAHDDELERDVALKFLPEVVAMDRQSVLELKRETRRSLELTHPHIIRIHDFVQQGHAAAISMEYVAGDTLASLKVDQPNHIYSPSQLERWVGQLCAAMEYAHSRAQVVHRDLKPANLMIESRGDLKIADFGIAASVSDSVSRVSAQAGSSGTPVYMSPQQMMGEKPAITDDIYSIGATLYDLLTGKPPFHAGNVMMQVQNKVPARLVERRREFEIPSGIEPIPEAWEETIAACLAKDPATRPQSADEVAQRLGLGHHVAPLPSTKPKTAAASAAAASSPGTQTETGAPAGNVAARGAKTSVIIAAGVAAFLLIGIAGWYFGLHLPEERRVEAERRAELLRRDEEQRYAQQEQKKRDDEAARLAALRIPVTVKTVPAGAEILIDGETVGPSPVTDHRLPPGEHAVVARLAGHEDFSQMLAIVEGGRTAWEFPLVRSTGELQLAGKPGDALYSVYDARNANGEPVAQGRLPANDLKLPTGRYRVMLAASEDSPVVHEETIEVARNAAARVDADVRGGTVTIDSTPGGAAIRINGSEAGRTPLTLERQVPGEKMAVELTLPGYMPESRTLTVGAADKPVEYSPTLAPKPAPKLPLDFTHGPSEFRVESTMTAKTLVSTGGNNQPAPDTHAKFGEVVAVSEPDGDGFWKRLVTRYEMSPGLPPNTVVQFDRASQEWRSHVLQGGDAGGAARSFFPSYPVAFLTPEALPAGEVKVGRTWEVPVTLANIVLPGTRFQLKSPGVSSTPPTGTIRGSIKAADLNAAQPWMELEYRFDVSGTMAVPAEAYVPNMTMTMSGREFGSWTMRVLLEEKYASHMKMERRSRITTSLAPLPTSLASKFGLVSGPPAPTSITTVEVDTTFESRVTPLSSAAAVKVPVGKDDPVVLHFYRKRAFEGGGNDIQVYLDGEKVGTLDNGGYFTVKRPAGRVRVSLDRGPSNPREYELEFVAGETAYFRLGFFSTLPFARLPEAEGKHIAETVQPTQPQFDQTRSRRND